MIKIFAKKGFSLPELLVGIGISVFVFSGVLGVFIGSQRTWSVAEARIRANEELRLLLTKMTKELRNSGYGKTGILPSYLSMGFQVPVDTDNPPDGIYNHDTEGNLIWGATDPRDGQQKAGYKYIYSAVPTPDGLNYSIVGDVRDATGNNISRDYLINDVVVSEDAPVFFGIPDYPENPKYITITITKRMTAWKDKTIDVTMTGSIKLRN